MPITRFRLVDTTWIPWEWVADDAEPVGTTRDDLVVGVDKPTPQTTGILTSVENLDEVGSGAPMNLVAGTYENKIFLGKVTFNITSGTVIFKNCWFAGNDPNLNDPENVIQNTASSTTSRPMVHLIDCTIDPGYWITHKGRTRIYPEINGVFGGNFNIQRCEITNVCDGVGIHAAYTTGITVELSWIHKSTFATGAQNTGQSDLRTHPDAFQFHTGKNIYLRGNVVGGNRDMVGYQMPFADAYNSGDDFENAGFMVKQEVSNDAARLLENIYIEYNWIYGCNSGINMDYDSGRPNLLATTYVRYNKFGPRGSNWGVTRRQDGSLSNTNGGSGYYIVRSGTLTSTITGNVREDTGQPVPINGG